MNGKQAKRLRRAAAGLAVTLTEAGKDIKKDGYTVKVHKKTGSAPSSILAAHGRDPDEVEAPVMPTYQIKVRQDSLKGIYKLLKSGKA